MRRLIIRWLTVGVLAIGLGVIALELSTGIAHERRGRAASGLVRDGAESMLPIGAEIDATEPSALPQLTH